MAASIVTAGSYRTTHLAAIHWGPGSVRTHLLPTLDALVHSHHAVHQGTKALILTGNSLATKTPIISDIEQLLRSKQKFAATFSDIGEHAPIEGIRRAQQLLQQHGAGVIVAVGGGSPIDAAKAISYYIHEADPKTKGDADERTFIPVIAIPTTLSVAETTQNAGYTENGRKVGVSDPAIVPRVLICDAELTLATPERLWLSTGIRALDHAIELLYRPDLNPLLIHQGIGAVRELFHLLPLSKDHTKDVNARQRLQLAVLSSLWPESRKGVLGLSHALGHALGSTYKIPHGITSCITLAGAVRFTARSRDTAPEALMYLSQALDSVPQAFTKSASANSQPSPPPPSVQLSAASSQDSVDVALLRRRGEAVADAVDALVSRLGLSTKLSDCGVPREHLAPIAEKVAAFLCAGNDDGARRERLGQGALAILEAAY